MNQIAKIGHNAPPTPFDEIKTRIEDLYAEAKQWLDGEPVTTQDQANALNTLENRIREAAKEAEALRKGEVKPLDDAKAEIQERFNALIGETKTVTGKTVMAIAAIKSALKPYLLELDRIQRETAAKAREEAEKAEQAARAAMQSREADNLEQREEADDLGLRWQAVECRVTVDVQVQPGSGAHLRSRCSGRQGAGGWLARERERAREPSA